jgi:hypothetical protein
MPRRNSLAACTYSHLCTMLQLQGAAALPLFRHSVHTPTHPTHTAQGRTGRPATNKITPVT